MDTIKWPLRPEAEKLATTINSYRKQNNVKPLPTCDTLNMVASIHVAHIMAFDNCNLWSWDSGPAWSTYGCVTDTSSPVMTSKPYEIARMKSKGYEMVHMHEDDSECSYNCAFWSFMKYPLFKSMMLGRWRKMGISVFRRAASVWFTAD